MEQILHYLVTDLTSVSLMGYSDAIIKLSRKVSSVILTVANIESRVNLAFVPGTAVVTMTVEALPHPM